MIRSHVLALRPSARAFGFVCLVAAAGCIATACRENSEEPCPEGEKIVAYQGENECRQTCASDADCPTDRECRRGGCVQPGGGGGSGRDTGGVDVDAQANDDGDLRTTDADGSHSDTVIDANDAPSDADELDSNGRDVELPSLLVHENFEDGDYTHWFSSAYDQGDHDAVTTETANSGQRSLRIDIAEGDHRGVHARVDPKRADLSDSNVRQMYTSYWVKFDPDFESDSNGGKLPGPRMREPEHDPGNPANGENGWSCLGKFGGDPEGIDVGYYTYHMDQQGGWGDHLVAATVPRDQWVRIEQYVAHNTVTDGSANRDGVLKMWVDGELLIDRTEMRFSNHPELGVNFHLLVYYGGADPSPADNHLFIDDWILADTLPTPAQRRALAEAPADNN